jgi:hypothetical protein
VAETQLQEYRPPWYRRWAEAPGDWRRRWRGMDRQQRFRVGIVLRAALIVFLLWVSWPLALFVAGLIVIQYGEP